MHQRRIYHGFGGKLYHTVPEWVRWDAIFHIRIRCAAENSIPLTDLRIAPRLLESVRFYEERGNWYVRTFLLMPDHVHALLVFAPDKGMSTVISGWKRFHARQSGIVWQGGYFDHRLRDHDVQLREKRTYILNNPVVKGLCAKWETWPWRYDGPVHWPETNPS